MTLIMSLAIAVIFGAGSYLLIKHDLVKVVAGVVLIGHAANLFIMAAGLSTGTEAIYPRLPGEAFADPLVQALTLTAIVITFGVSALLLTLIYRVYQAHLSLNIETLSDMEEQVTRVEERTAPSPDIAEETPVLPEAGEDPDAIAAEGIVKA